MIPGASGITSRSQLRTPVTHKNYARGRGYAQMASIVPFRDGWRAHIYVRGERESKTFRTQREAKSWADRRESELEAGGTRITFGEAAARWLKWKLPQLDNPEHQHAVEQSLDDYVLPKLGHLQLADIKRKELVEVVSAVAARGAVETSHRVGQRIRAIFDHAIDHGDIESHPAAGLSRILPPVQEVHQPAIRPEDLPQLLRDIAGYSEPVTRAGLFLMAHTFLRTSELIGAEWPEFVTADVWVVPAERMKLRLPHVVPLSTHVRTILAGLRPMTDESRYVLASPLQPESPISKNTLLFALYRLGYKGRMTGHGFRTVASSILNESGKWSPDAIERQLAHKETDKVREAYHRAEYLDERRRMMEWWSAHLAAMASITQR